MLNYNGLEVTLDCLSSLESVVWECLTTIVVDNGSTDGSADAIAERYPRVELIRCAFNLGFAEGNNVGLRRALELGADYVFVLNNDTIVADDAVTELVAEAARRPDAGALCPLVYFADPPDLIWCAGATFDPRKGYSGRMTGYREPDRGQYSTVREVERAPGAAILVPRQVLERVGLLDGDLFLYYEDVEWSLRIRRAGYMILLIPSACVWHKVSVTAGGEHSPTAAYYGTRNHLEVCARHAPLDGVRSLRRHLALLAVHLVHARRARRPLANMRAVVEGWRDYRRGRLGPRERALEVC